VALRLDSPANGRTIGRLQVPSTGGRYEWTSVEAAVQKVSGTRDLYLVFEGEGVRLDALQFAGRGAAEAPARVSGPKAPPGVRRRAQR
jgi:Carbohydrate binding module (family 6)